MEEIERHTSLFSVPAGVGRIGSNYGGFTAEQWNNWILIYSTLPLKGLLPSNHMGCCLLYVNACKLLCKPILQKDDIYILLKWIGFSFTFAALLSLYG